MEETSIVIAILTAMITPAVLILACGSLSLTTSQRLSRSIARTRLIANDLKEITSGRREATLEEQHNFRKQLKNSARRAVLLQRAMTQLYTALSFFIATSLLIGVFELMEWEKTYAVTALSLIGAVILLTASITLILETRLALSSVSQEMSEVLKTTRKSAIKKGSV